MLQSRVALVKTTLVDYPGEIASTVFTAGCNLRCPYCHNPEFVTGPPPDDLVTVESVFEFLNRRRSSHTGVCITGGEPLIHDWVPEFSARVHDMGFRIKLDTNGLLPDRIGPVAADYIALDIKTAPARYHRLADGAARSERLDERIQQSIIAVRESGAKYEFRTTVLDPFVTKDDISEIVALLEPGERYTIAAFRPGHTLDRELENAAPPEQKVLEEYAALARDRGLDVQLRTNQS